MQQTDFATGGGPRLVNKFYNPRLGQLWDVLLEDFLPMFSLSMTSSLQTTAGLDLGPPLRRRTPCGVFPWSWDGFEEPSSVLGWLS